MYYDLNLPRDEAPLVQRERLCIALRLGYDSVAATYTRAGALGDADRCSIRPLDREALASGGQEFPRMLALRAGKALAAADAAGQSLTQLTRLTVAASDPVQAQQAFSNTAVLRSYDLLAVQPKSERVLQQACSSLDVDIIAIDLAQRLPFKLKPATLAAASSRGIVFEISYALALREDTARRHLFSNAQALAAALRGKSIILSSGARNGFELRGPYDVMAMATLFGLSQAQAKAAVSASCEAAVRRGAARKLLAGAVSIVQRSPQQGAEPSGTAAEPAAAAAGPSVSGGAAGGHVSAGASSSQAGSSLGQTGARDGRETSKGRQAAGGQTAALGAALRKDDAGGGDHQEDDHRSKRQRQH